MDSEMDSELRPELVGVSVRGFVSFRGRGAHDASNLAVIIYDYVQY